MNKKFNMSIVNNLMPLSILVIVAGVYLGGTAIMEVESAASMSSSPERLYIVAAIPGVAVIFAGLTGAAVGLTAKTTDRIEQKLEQFETLMRHQDSLTSATPTDHTKIKTNMAETSTVKKSGEGIKVFKGYNIVKADKGVAVAGQGFSDVLAAEQWINEREASPGTN
jgi:hypothetical protein